MRREGIVAAALLGWALAAQPVAAQDPVAPIDGACDESSRNGCAAGTANDDAFPDYPTVYVWRCDGLHGGQNSQKCIKFVAVNGVCDESVRNGCAAGRPNDDAFPDHPTIHVWRCDGLHGGQNSEKCVRRPDEPGGGWSAWSACSASTCGTSGKQTRTCTDPPAGQRNCLRQDGTRGSDEVRPCTGATPENGGWSDWSACSATSCGAAGTQTRTCNNPVPGCGGSECTGPSTRACTGATPVDGGWSAWSQCSASDCNAGGTRTRSCTNPAPACGGQDCTGDSSQACTAGGASNGVWETGAWSEWTACSGSTCTQSRGRSVTCSPPACGGAPCDPATKPAATETRACPNPAWQTGSWSAWSTCNPNTCGAAGTQTRTRRVDCPCDTACSGTTKPASSQTQACTGNAPRHGVWRASAWGSWTCGAASCTLSRTRRVLCMAPGCGGNACNTATKPPTSETGAQCSNPPSPQWTIGRWGEWSECSATACDAAGNKTRTRAVTCPCGSTECPTPKPATRQTESCTGNNPLNGRCGVSVDNCVRGTYKDEADTATYYKWRCEGGCGGTTASCRRRGPQCSGTATWSGGCSAAGSTGSGSSIRLRNAASCRTGSATFQCELGTWGSATSGTCTATAATNGSCNNAVVNGCTAGKLQDVADTTALAKWNCVGDCGGTTAQCSKGKLTTLTVSISVSGGSGQGTATATVSGGTPPYTYSWRVRGADARGSGRSITFSYRSGIASSLIDISVLVTDSVGLFGSAETGWGTPPGGGP